MTSTLEQLVVRYVGENYFDTSFPELSKPFHKLSHGKRTALIRHCLRYMTSAQTDDDLFVAAHVLVALYPQSLPSIEELLKRREGPQVWEVHYKLFSTFSAVEHLPYTFERAIEALIEEYLVSVERNRAHAAWMASRCLGEHWSPTPAIPVLMRIYERARYVDGREAALVGLREVYERTKSASIRRRILQVLQQAANKDRSVEGRTAALRGLHQVYKRTKSVRIRDRIRQALRAAKSDRSMKVRASAKLFLEWTSS